jgi:tol-pal system protein YbgF
MVLLLVTGVLAGCATQGSLDLVRSDTDSVKTRLFTVEKDLAAFQEETRGAVKGVEQGYKTDMETMRKLFADLQATVDSVKSDLQALNGKLDDMGVAARKPSEELARYRDDADKRIIGLDDRVTRLQTALDELSRKTGDHPAPGKDDSQAAEALYAKGLEIFKAGDMSAARDLFARFLEQYPQHDLAANAQYWIGETFYSEKSYEPAILAYQEVIKQYPNKEKVSAAMLKQAMSFRAIKDLKSARFVLKKLVEGYPRSEEAKRGKELLKEIK